MNKFKKLIIVTLCLLILPISSILTGCEFNEPVSILSIEKTATDGLVDTYTIYYTDGTSTTFIITNGKDGKDGIDGEDGVDGENGENGTNGTDGVDGVDGVDGSSITIMDIYNQYVKENGEISYTDFLKEFLTINLGNNSSIINDCLRSSLKVYALTPETYYGEKDYSISAGSAFIYKIEQDYTYIVTNYHVVYTDQNRAAIEGAWFNHIAETMVGYLYGSDGGPSTNGEKDSQGYPVLDFGSNGIEMQYVGGSVTSDIAVLKARTADVLAINPNVKAVTFADGYRVGETAIAIGNSEGMGISATQGIVSVDNEYIELDLAGEVREYRCMRIDTAIYSGNSGGPLFNCNGELIGITNAGDVTSQNINYAIPLNIAKNTIEGIMYYSKNGGNQYLTTKVIFGVTVISSNSRYVYNAETGYGEIVEVITVDSTVDNSIARAMNLQQGQILTAMNINGVDYVLKRNFHISDYSLMLRAGDVIKFKYTDGGNEAYSTEYTIKAEDLVTI